ncbi:MAG: S41 family peptidase [Salibacteraceae bacterium]
MGRFRSGSGTLKIRFENMKNSARNKTLLAVFGLTIALFSTAYVDSYFEITKNLDLFASVYKEVNVSYVEEVEPGKLVKTGIDAMLSSLDPYTNYIPEADIEDYRFMTTHEYGGIGALIGQRDKKIMLTEVYENSPAYKAGLRAGDVIVSVDGIEAHGKNSTQLSEMLRGATGTQVTVSVFRPATNASFTTKITRDKIKIEDVPYFGMLDSETGYIALNSFTETASIEVKKAYEKLKQNGMRKLIFDLRGNGGGLLLEAVNIVNFFVPKGESVVEVKGKLKENYKLYKALKQPLDLDVPLTVLIDESSASASEIVAGTLQDLDRAVIVGRPSYGKGLVQSTVDLSYNAKLKITIAKYYTPSGRCIQRIDYGKRDSEGNPLDIPDSLTTTYETRKGREVKDGAGILPDVLVEEDQYSDLLITILNENLVFDFATQYYFKHDSIAPPEEFKLSDAEYDQFVQFVIAHDFEYKTSSAKVMEELKEVIAQDEFMDEVQNEFDALYAKLQRDKKQDLKKFRTEIQRTLENEIISRYYFTQGRIRSYLTFDKTIAEAKKILNNKELYSSVLDGTCDSCLVKKRRG